MEVGPRLEEQPGDSTTERRYEPGEHLKIFLFFYLFIFAFSILFFKEERTERSGQKKRGKDR